eukprot:1769027-Amphidinium_carterae.1
MARLVSELEHGRPCSKETWRMCTYKAPAEPTDDEKARLASVPYNFDHVKRPVPDWVRMVAHAREYLVGSVLVEEIPDADTRYYYIALAVQSPMSIELVPLKLRPLR